MQVSPYFRYTFTPADARTAEQRHPRLMTELGMLSGDIICLQEVGENYISLLSDGLGQRGYTGQFYQKTLGIMEGLATFYNNTMFDCIAVEKISYNEMLADALQEEGIDYPADADDHVFLVMKMKHLETDLIVTVGNIHSGNNLASLTALERKYHF